MGSVQKKKTKDGWRYYAIYKVPGRQYPKWEAGGRLKKNAEALLRRREGEIANGTYGRLTEISFAEFSARWLDEYVALKVKPRTLDDYEQVVRIHLIPFFGKFLLSNITPADVQKYTAIKVGSGKSSRTVGKTLTILKAMLKQAMIWGYLSENPARFVQAPRKVQSEMDYLCPEEVRCFLEAASPEYYPLFATAIFTGARQGELLALRWADIDLGRGIIYIKRTYDPKHGFGEPKSAKGRRAVIMSPQLVSILASFKARTDPSPDSLVFSNRAGHPINAQNMMTREFYPTLERAGIRHVRFHDLRHTYAALMIALRESPKFIQTQMGHSSITVTMDNYGHLLPEASAGIGARFDQLIFSQSIIPLPRRDSRKEMPLGKSI